MKHRQKKGGTSSVPLSRFTRAGSLLCCGLLGCGLLGHDLLGCGGLCWPGLPEGTLEYLAFFGFLISASHDGVIDGGRKEKASRASPGLHFPVGLPL